MKIALCLSGKPTSSIFCFPYIYDTFLNNKNIQTDVFIHTWEDSKIINFYNPKKFEIEKYETDTILKFLFSNIVFPENMKVEGNITNNLLQFYSLKKVFDLVPENEYDYIVRCRFDVLIENKFCLEEIFNYISINKFDIFCPDEIFNFGGYQDRIYMGDYQSMKIASNIIENVNFLVNDLKKWHPETFLKRQLDEYDIKVYQKDINHRLIRKVNIETNWPENPYKFLDL
jgi:hypothetical protein